jgi:tRNA dimethylallyltransferase
MALARLRGDIEIISVDSMAVYREMDLATAKPSKSDRAAVPHHLVDVLDPGQECTVVLCQELATQAIDEVRSRGHIPVLVGGTGLYHRAVIDQMEIPGQFPEIRAQLEVLGDDPDGGAVLMARLHELDPEAASRIEPGNLRRLIRALEVIEGTGRPFSSFGPGLESYGDSPVLQIGITIEAPLLSSVIEERVASWMKQGLLAEVEGLAVRPGGLSRTARQAIGYRELLGVVEQGADLDEAVDATVARTRVFARRQRAWFRRDPRVRWVAPEAAFEVAVSELKRIATGLEMGD